MDNNRRYFRIDDLVLLDVQTIEPVQRKEINDEIRRRQGKQRNIHQVFLGMEDQVESLVERVGQQHYEIGKVLSMLNNKLNMLEEGMRENGLGGSSSSAEMAMRKVNISACGVRFESDINYPVGQCLNLEIVLFPDYLTVRVLGDVVSTAANEQGSPHPYAVSADFNFADESTQEILVQHIMRKQSDVLQKRQEGDDEK